MKKYADVAWKRMQEIDDIFSEKYGEHYNHDGVVDVDSWECLEPGYRILWVLKEDGMNASGKKGFYLYGFYNDIANGDDSAGSKTIHTIAEMTYAFLKHITDIKQMPAYETYKAALKQIAFVEVKKDGGMARSNPDVIAAYYQKDKDLILDQIAACCPDVIINCSRVDAVFDDLKQGEVKESEHPFRVSHCENGILIDAPHPGQMTITNAQYLEQLWQCYNWAQNNK